MRCEGILGGCGVVVVHKKDHTSLFGLTA